MRFTHSALALVFVAAAPHFALGRQCPGWSSTFSEPGPNESVFALHVFDDGSGPALYAGGDFTYVGAVAAKRVAKWDGSSWSPLGQGLSDAVAAIADFDSGSGAELYAGGGFVYTGDGTQVFGIARWDGSAWQPLGGGTNSSVADLQVHDDGSGPALYVGGFFEYVFDETGPVYSPGVARWNGSSWSAVGGGVGLDVTSLAVFDDGSGPELYAAGDQTGAPSALMRWNGTAWFPVNAPLVGPGNSLKTLTVHDDGSGSALYAAGRFGGIGGVTANGIAKFDGTSWSALGAGITGSSVDTLASFDDGSGNKLYAGGWFTNAGGASVANLASWDGSTWSEVGGGTQATVATLGAFDSGAGPTLFVGGIFDAVGPIAALHLARWDGATWSASAPGAGMHVEGTARIDALTEVDDGSGPALYALGFFKHIGLATVESLARWNGSSWSPLGGFVWGASAIAAFDDGNGTALFAAASQIAPPVQGVHKWDGSAWTPIGYVTTTLGGAGTASELTTFDDGSGSALILGGAFAFVDSVPANSVAKWNGSSWSALGGGVSGPINAMTVFDDGAGAALYVGGSFNSAGGGAANGVAKWNGTTWSALGVGLNGTVLALAVHDDGSGPALYAGGQFITSGTTTVNRIARWNGTSWSALGSGASSDVQALASYHDGQGSALFAAGRFTTIDGVSAKRIAKWNGASWTALDDGLGPVVCHALAVFHDGVTPQGSLYAGGDFRTADGLPSTGIARWTNTCACSGTSYCTSGVTSNGCVPTISGVGTASASATSGFTISVSSVEGQKQGHIFYGVTGPNAASWGASSHFLCVKAPTQRTGTQDSGGTAGACDGVIALDWNNYIATHPGSLGQPFSAGTSVWAQLYFRDPPGPKTTALSNGLMFTVCP